MERVFAVELTGPGHRKNSLGETLPGVRLVSKAELSPWDGGPGCLLRWTVCGFHSLIKEAGKQMIPVVEQSLGPGAHLCIRAGQALATVPFHPCLHQSGGILELLSARGLVGVLPERRCARMGPLRYLPWHDAAYGATSHGTVRHHGLCGDRQVAFGSTPVIVGKIVTGAAHGVPDENGTSGFSPSR